MAGVGTLQIYGAGFPAELRLTSPILDLGAAKALTSVEWDADIPPGTRLELRSRTGGEVVENVHYFDKKATTAL